MTDHQESPEWAYPHGGYDPNDPKDRHRAEDFKSTQHECPVCGGNVGSVRVSGVWKWVHLSELIVIDRFP